MLRYIQVGIFSFLFLLTACSTNKARKLNDEIGFVTINSTPWGKVYINDRYIDSTPVVKHALETGTHQLLVKRKGFRAHNQEISITRSNTSVYSVRFLAKE